MANLLEAYSKRLAIAESFYAKHHDGEKMDKQRKIVTAKLLENCNRYLNEAFDNSVGMQRGDLGAFKKFALNLTTVAVPSLIANDIVIVHPMSSLSGYVNYLSYSAGSNKGNVQQTNTFNSVFGLYQQNNANAEYTSSKVSTNGTTTAQTVFALTWSPVVKGTVDITTVLNGESVPTHCADDGQGNLKKVTTEGTRVETVDRWGNVSIAYEGRELGDTVVGTVAYEDVGDTKANITFRSAVVAAKDFALSYVYNNVYIPQNDIPLLNAHMDAIPLIAHARRIAVYYSQMEAFQAKQDYNLDLGAALAEQAVGQLAYEIDTEVVQTLVGAAGNVQPALTWSKTQPIGVSLFEHFESFMEILGRANQIIYDRTKKFAANYMLIASDVLPVVQLLRGWKAAPAGKINGPYLAGTINSLKVFVTPTLSNGKFVVGVNGDDMLTSAAVYAPYMAIVPTQLLQYADGGTSQGFSTLYDIKVLNANLVVAGQIVA